MYLVLKVDLLMVAHFLGEKQTGWYSVAVAMADWIYVLPSVIGTILFPKLASLPSLSEKWQHTKSTAYSVGLVMGAVVGIAIAVADPAVRMLFGDEFHPAVLPFIYLMPGVLFLSVGSVYAAFVGAIGQPLAFPLGTALIATINVILNIMFLEHFGILFAAISSSLSYVLFFLLGFLTCQSYAKGGISQ
jgi:O-antigen/teichoic acid export membrane protein